MVFVDDEQSVGDFASDDADEPFDVGVGSRAGWWDLHDLNAGGGEDRVERGGELAGPVLDRNRKSSISQGSSPGCGPAGCSKGRRGWWWCAQKPSPGGVGVASGEGGIRTSLSTRRMVEVATDGRV
ncbi:hypothetical protein ACFYOT_38040 [Saccharothrix saharensis]|uniref:hypothetical protein n=1 Tax=Saccharothrix saharensis TaxID=571190 RepID=UPI0036BDC915